jgi:hypothetical protein
VCSSDLIPPPSTCIIIFTISCGNAINAIPQRSATIDLIAAFLISKKERYNFIITFFCEVTKTYGN